MKNTNEKMHFLIILLIYAVWCNFEGMVIYSFLFSVNLYSVKLKLLLTLLNLTYLKIKYCLHSLQMMQIMQLLCK